MIVSTKKLDLVWDTCIDSEVRVFIRCKVVKFLFQKNKEELLKFYLLTVQYPDSKGVFVNDDPV